jgi:hypothetical protein
LLSCCAQGKGWGRGRGRGVCETGVVLVCIIVGFMIDHAFMRCALSGRSGGKPGNETFQKKSNKLKSIVGGGSDWEAESGECTVTVWTLDCGVSFVGRGRVVCFLFLEFHIMHILVHPRFTPPSPFFSLRLCFSVRPLCAYLSGRAMIHAREKRIVTRG